jgi:hypothetical protein
MSTISHNPILRGNNGFKINLFLFGSSENLLSSINSSSSSIIFWLYPNICKLYSNSFLMDTNAFFAAFSLLCSLQPIVVKIAIIAVIGTITMRTTALNSPFKI